MRSVYLDYSATSPTRPEVVEEMLPFFHDNFGNPSSAHHYAEMPQQAVQNARRSIGSILNCDPEEIIFTSGGTESDNLAVKGVVLSASGKKGHVITSCIEHKAVLESCRFLERQGLSVTYLPVDGAGLVSPDDLRKTLRPDTVLISIMHANNEVGTVQPVGELSVIAREAGIPFHTDAVQSFGKIASRIDALGVQLLSLSSHKIYGPKGVGALYVGGGVKIAPLFHGGHHERGKRAGTENVPGIVGLGCASRLLGSEMKQEGSRLKKLRDRLWEGISSSIERVHLHGSADSRLPHLASIGVEGIEGEALLLSLDMKGVSVSTGSACTSDSLQPSHVLTAMGIDPVLAQGTIRFSLGTDTSEEDIDYVIDIFPDIVSRLRHMSPLA